LISTTVMEVLQLAQQAQQSSSQMEQLSKNMVAVFDAFQKIVVENTQSTQKMKDSFQIITDAIQAVAQLSTQNTQSVQQVLSKNDEMRNQMDDVVVSADTLNRMAGELQDTVQKFRLN
jgi:methyl-accepting chemotaxis protein